MKTHLSTTSMQRAAILAMALLCQPSFGQTITYVDLHPPGAVESCDVSASASATSIPC